MDSALAPELASIRDWILSKHAEAVTLDLDTDLIENRLIDSMAFAEFLFRLEAITGTVIDLAGVDLDTFRTLRSIQRRFLPEAADVR